MRQNLTESLRQTLDHAQEQARQLNQEYVTTEHLVLGMLASDGTDARRSLQACHIDAPALRKALLTALPKADSPSGVTGALPMSQTAQQVLNNAIVKAQALRVEKVGTRLLLSALLEEGPSAVRDALRSCGADLDDILRQLAHSPQTPEA